MVSYWNDLLAWSGFAVSVFQAGPESTVPVFLPHTAHLTLIGCSCFGYSMVGDAMDANIALGAAASRLV